MLTLLADVARHPNFPQEEIERQRASRLASLVQQRENPNAVATRGDVRGALRPGASVRLHRARDRGVEQGDDARRSADVLDAELRRRTTRRWSCRGRSRSTELKPLVEKAFGDWQTGHAGARRAAGDRRRPRRRLMIVDKPGAPQTQLRVASIGVAALDARLRADRGDERDRSAACFRAAST